MDNLHLALGLQIIRLDVAESRAWQARSRGLYVAPGIPEQIARNVALTLACIAMEARR